MRGKVAFNSDQREIRRLLLAAAHKAQKGHIASALSIADLVLATELAFGELQSDQRQLNLVLSKGHAASALYAFMVLRDQLSMDELVRYCSDGSILGTHPPAALPGVSFATGSLGQGIGFAVGLALADSLQQKVKQTVCIMSDAELNEGSSWEAFMHAAKFNLQNFTVMVDMNGQQALGRTHEVIDTSGFELALIAMGWEVREVDGHSLPLLEIGLKDGRQDAPRLLLCRTVSGKGVTFMENRIEWHYLPITDAQYRDAVRDIDSGGKS